MHWNYLHQRRQNNSLPHALLLTGLPDLEFPRLFSKSLLCLKPDLEGKACNNCRTCSLMQAGSHPDFYQIEPEETGKTIRIDQIRELISELNQTAQQGGYKIAIIAPAEAMQMGAANALLKTLEEPAANTLIMLVSNQPGLLAATLRSRCQKLNFPLTEVPLTAEQQECQQRLLAGLEKLSDGSMDPVQFAATWQKDSLSEIILQLTQIIMDKIRLKSSLKMFSYLDELYKIRRSLNLAINLNQQLVLENLFITWYEYTHA